MREVFNLVNHAQDFCDLLGFVLEKSQVVAIGCAGARYRFFV